MYLLETLSLLKRRKDISEIQIFSFVQDTESHVSNSVGAVLNSYLTLYNPNKKQSAGRYDGHCIDAHLEFLFVVCRLVVCPAHLLC